MPHTAAPASPAPCHATRWKAATIACLLLLAVGTAMGVSMFEQFKAQVQHLQSQLKTTAQIQSIAVLLDAKQAPAMLITWDPQDGALQLQRLNAVTEGREDSMQLWALSANDKPRSLGVLESKAKTLRLPARADALTKVHTLAISVENKGGVAPDSAPRLPYLFSGAVVHKAM